MKVLDGLVAGRYTKNTHTKAYQNMTFSQNVKQNLDLKKMNSLYNRNEEKIATESKRFTGRSNIRSFSSETEKTLHSHHCRTAVIASWAGASMEAITVLSCPPGLCSDNTNLEWVLQLQGKRTRPLYSSTLHILFYSFVSP